MDPVWINLVSGLVGAAAGGVLALLGSMKAMAFDNDRASDPDGIARKEIGAILEYEGQEWSAALGRSDLIVMPRVAIFGEDFEKALRELFGSPDSELEDQARQEFGLAGEALSPWSPVT